MNKIYILITVSLLTIGAFSSGYLFSEYTKKPEKARVPILTLIDGAGRTVNITKTPQRIVSIAASTTEILYALGCGDKIVGRDRYSNYPPEALEKPEVGTSTSINLEMIVGLEPDLVMTWWFATEAINSLEERGIPVFAINPQSVSDVLQTIRTIGLIVNKTTEAENLVADMQSKIDEITSKTKGLNKTQRPLVYYELGSVGKTVGPGTFTNELIFMAGGINIAADEPFRYPLLNSEYIIERNPDVIIVISYGASPEEIKSREGWQTINAVKNNRVYVIDTGLVTSNPRIVQGLEQFAKWFHPELFGTPEGT
jgi:iron complex transport system substrate-binding protein